MSQLLLRTKTLLFFLFLLQLQITFGNQISHTLGPPSQPFFHNLLSSQQTCRIHLMFNELSTENLAHTSNIAVTLSKLTTNSTLNPRIPLNILQNKGWTCELLFFYVKGATPTNSSDSIKQWIQFYTKSYIHFRDVGRFVWSRSIANGHLHILLVTRQVSLPIHTLSGDNTFGFRIQMGNNFAILYHPEGPSDKLLCIRLYLDVYPAHNHFKCDKTQLPITEDLQDWYQIAKDHDLGGFQPELNYKHFQGFSILSSGPDRFDEPNQMYSRLSYN